MSRPSAVVRTRPGGRVLGWLLVVGLAMVGVASAPVAAETTDEPSDPAANQQFVSVDLDIIGGVPWNNGLSVPGQVAVEANRAVSGTLSVLDDPEGGSPTTWEFDIDLAAGSRATFPVTLTTGWNGIAAAASVRSGGALVGSDELRQGGNAEQSARHVAVLGIDDPPRRVQERGTDRQLGTIDLGTDLRALENASTLVATASAIRELGQDSTAGAAIDAWVRGGGQLLIDGPAASLDDRYHRYPTANPDRFAFGTGSVYYDEAWRDGVPLGGYVGSLGLAQLVENQGLGTGAGGELAILADLALPGIGLVAVVLLAYAIVAGPVLFLGAGAMGQHRRIWTVLPALSLVVAAGMLTMGFIDRRDRTDAHITIVEVSPEGSRATTNLLVGSDFGGNRQLETPDGWTYLGQGRTSGQRPIQLRVGRTSTAVGIEMPPGSNAVVRMAGIAPSYDGLLTIDDISTDGDGTILAEVTNNSDVALEEAVAFLGNVRSELGTLAPGQAVEIAIEAEPGSTRTMRELLLWPRVDVRWNERGPAAAPRDPDAVTAAGAWTEWRVDQGMTASPENVLGVVAWSDRLATPLGGIDRGRTALFARTNLPDGLGPATGFATVSRLPGNDGEPVFDGNFVGRAEDVRVTLGPDTDIGDLALAVDDQSSAVGVWIDGGWRYIDLPNNGAATILLPPEAAEDGELLLRSFRPDWAWGLGSTIRLIPAAGVEASPASLGTTVDHRLTEPGVDERFGPEGGDRRLAEVIEEVVVDLGAGETFVHVSELNNQTVATFLIDLERDQELVATLRSPQHDSYLEIWDADENVLQSNDDFGERVDSRIQFEAPEDGTYTVRAHELTGQAMDYELTLELDR